MEKEFVEIAGIKWATMNIGAEKETDIGLYFQLGDTQGYTFDEIGRGEDENLFNWQSYKYCDGTGIITKYNHSDNKFVLNASDDAATAAWGDGWRTPTRDELKALGAAVTTLWTDDYKGSGVAGMVCTDKTDSSKVLFFPACGRCYNGDIHNVGRIGDYWSSSINTSNAALGCDLYFNRGYVNWQDYSSRNSGYPVRGIMK